MAIENNRRRYYTAACETDAQQRIVLKVGEWAMEEDLLLKDRLRLWTEQ